MNEEFLHPIYTAFSMKHLYPFSPQGLHRKAVAHSTVN